MNHQGMKENYFYGVFIKGANLKPPSYAEIRHIKLQMILLMCEEIFGLKHLTQTSVSLHMVPVYIRSLLHSIRS